MQASPIHAPLRGVNFILKPGADPVPINFAIFIELSPQHGPAQLSEGENTSYVFI